MDFIGDENTAEDRYSFPPDIHTSNFLDGEDLVDNEDRTMSQFYNNLLTRASKNATRPLYNQENDESLFEDLLRRQFRADNILYGKLKLVV